MNNITMSLSSLVDWQTPVNGPHFGDNLDDSSSEGGDSYDSLSEPRLSVYFPQTGTYQTHTETRSRPMATQGPDRIQPYVLLPSEVRPPELDACNIVFSRVEQEKRAVLGEGWTGVVSAIDLVN